MGFPGGSVVKELPANAEDAGSILGLERSPGEGNVNPLQYSCLENPVDARAWHSPWSHKESDMTERLHLTSLHFILPQTPLPSRLPHNIEQGSLCSPVCPCCLSILNTALCTCQSEFLS